MTSNRAKKNQKFLDLATLKGARTAADIKTNNKFTSRNGSTDIAITRFRSGSITETHMHGPTRVGTAKHTDRSGRITKITQNAMNAATRAFAKSRG